MRGHKTPLTKSEKAAALRRRLVRDAFDRADGKAQKTHPSLLNLRWAALAVDMGVSIHTVQHWARLGVVPLAQAKALENRYGRAVVKHEDLISASA